MASAPLHAVWAVRDSSGAKKVGWLCFTCHSSLGKSDMYRVEIECEFSTFSSMEPGDVPHVEWLRSSITSISSAICACRSGLLGQCWHIGLGMFFLHNQLRIDAVGQSPTAVLQRWNRPSGAALVLSTHSGAQRAATLSHCAPRADGAGGGYVSMRTYAPAVSVGGRGAYSPPALTLPSRTDPRWTKTRERLHAIAKASAGGILPAAAVWDLPLSELEVIRNVSHNTRVDEEAATSAAMVEGGMPAVASLKRRRAEERKRIKSGAPSDAPVAAPSDAPVAAAEALAEAPAGQADRRAPLKRARESSAAPCVERERPFFQKHPDLRICSSAAPSPDAPDSVKPFLCKWCGWFKDIHRHFRDGCGCPRWEIGEKAALRASDWSARPTHRTTPRAAFVVPNIGETFAEMNPAARRHKARAAPPGVPAAAGPRVSDDSASGDDGI
jgi:hypothetical protein